jgi:hypothetical protein
MANCEKSCNISPCILDPCHGEDVREIPLRADSAEGRVAGLGPQHDFQRKVMKHAFKHGLRAFLRFYSFRSSFICVF